MLTQETKRKIDSARQILVGKVPDPKAQVDQITTAMIYKFMDDMDKDAMELGGKARFFTNGFEKYAWSKLMDLKLGGHERLELYAEAVVQMSTNPHIPQLFRDIFKDAFLPYRSPETLSLFLKEINGFTYDHSEDLGDAFEYLLSIMGSQGDAGQFRTPRHIIDFIVAVVDPKKDETILDPACGTAGFLISAYKHILEQHDGLDDPDHKEKPLTPDEKKKLMGNLFGYDISPDMVKLSKVNMYLHGFAEPKIFEYDTLSSDEKWDEMYDVIMANPPFMSPKGGIRPHKRFSVQANRAEVLFVDYIIEHLRNKGRTGVIVPEGIIFQSGNAYKKLRKLLLENGLYAVASLPAGVFQPYSGVKTSVLFFDKQFKHRDQLILFIDVKNTGISLGATNVSIKENDLPNAIVDISRFKSGSNNFLTSWTGSKQEIINNDYSLSGNLYKHIKDVGNDKKFVALGEVVKITKGKSSSTKTLEGQYPLYLTAEEKKSSDHFDFDGDGVAVPLISALGHGRAAIKRVHRVKGKFALANLLAYLEPNKKQITPEFLYLVLNSRKDEIAKLMKGAANVSMKVEDLETFQIPLPPLEIQKEIVEQIEGYQKIVDLASEMTQVKGINISIDPSWQRMSLDDLATIRYGYTTTANDNGDARFVRITDINEYGELDSDNQKFITLDDDSRKYLLKNSDVLVARTGATFGKTMIFKEDYSAVFASYLIRLQFDESKILPEYYWCFAQTKDYWDQANNLVTGGGQPQFNGNVLKSIQVPLPTLEKQKEIAEEFLKIRNQLINQNLELVEIFNKRIQQVIEKI